MVLVVQGIGPKNSQSPKALQYFPWIVAAQTNHVYSHRHRVGNENALNPRPSRERRLRAKRGSRLPNTAH